MSLMDYVKDVVDTQLAGLGPMDDILPVLVYRNRGRHVKGEDQFLPVGMVTRHRRVIDVAVVAAATDAHRVAIHGEDDIFSDDTVALDAIRQRLAEIRINVEQIAKLADE